MKKWGPVLIPALIFYHSLLYTVPHRSARCLSVSVLRFELRAS